jgi:hypothetical protein
MEGSGRLGASVALVPDDGYRLALGERRAGGERLIELARAQPLAELGGWADDQPAAGAPLARAASVSG